MGTTIAIIGCIVGIVTCTIGVATFVSARISKANQDGRMLEKIEYACKGIDEIRSDMKENDGIIKDHSVEIAELQTKVKNLEKVVFDNK